MIEYPLEQGGSVVVLTADAPPGPVTRGWGADRPGQVLEKADETFEEALGKVRSAADAMLASLSGLSTRPDEIAVEFAVQLSAEAGVCIATLGATANFKVALTWRPS
jgi:hypothetical protein